MYIYSYPSTCGWNTKNNTQGLEGVGGATHVLYKHTVRFINTHAHTHVPTHLHYVFIHSYSFINKASTIFS